MSLPNLIRRHIPQKYRDKIKSVLGLPATRLNPAWAILDPVGPTYSDHTIIDIGAHNGWFFHCWKDWCPAAKVHAFEPAPKAYDNLIKKYRNDKDITINHCGVGDTITTAELNIMSQSQVSNSFLKPYQKTWDQIAYKTGNIDQLEIQMITLDQYVNQSKLKNIYLLKIDVQGLELAVLRGASDCLNSIDHILVESAIQPLYQEAALFSQVFDFLSARGFHLMAMRSWHRGNNVLIETDMLFRRNGLETEIDHRVERVYS